MKKPDFDKYDLTRENWRSWDRATKRQFCIFCGGAAVLWVSFCVFVVLAGGVH